MLLKNKSLILSMVTLGHSEVYNEELDKVEQTIRFRKVYIDLISKKKDNNSLQHLVAQVSMRVPGSVYGQAFIRQGSSLWNFGLQIDDDFEQARTDLKNIQKYTLSPNSRVQTLDPSVRAELAENSNILDPLPESEGSNPSNAQMKEKEGLASSVEARNPQIIPRTKGARRIAQINLCDDDHIDLNSSNSDQEIQEMIHHDSDNEIIVSPTKKCKKNYTRFIKSISRGLTIGCRKGIKDCIDNMDMTILEDTSNAITQK